jgi:methionyl-tRNA synthetase
MSNRFYITTPIYYVNAEPHLGHAYTTIVADVAARFHRLAGDEVRFQTGTDEHGDKIAQAALEQGVEPKAYADRISGMFESLWPQLHISHDNFIRTTDPEHIRVVQAILQKVYDAGDIYLGTYGGNYCVGCERFLTDKELVNGKCPEHDSEPVFIEEENYFFKMAKYQDALVKHIKANPEFIRPQRYKNEVLAMLEGDKLDDLCISRPKSRLTWGIELPFDDNFVTYVWFDALINYLTGLGWPDGENYQTFWPAAQHLIAKDILKPHAIFWPTMLMAAGVPLYQHLNVHGYWNVDAAKMSKSLGNVVRPLELAEVYGVEAFRYFVMREMSFGLDSNFSEKLLVERYNSDLANDLGNLFSRVLNMLHKFCGGVVPTPDQQQPQDADLTQLTLTVAAQYVSDNRGFAFHKALAAVWSLIGAGNKYVVANEPWSLAKDPEQAGRLGQVMYNLCQLLAQVTVLIWPVMPQTAERMAEVLGLEGITPDSLQQVLAGGELIKPGAAIQKPPALFPRIDTAKVKAKADKAEKKAEAKKPQEKKKQKKKMPSGPAPEITFDEFARLELKVGTVINAEPIKGADRLLKLTVDAGEDEPRTVVAGVAEHYGPDELKGKQVVIVANLKPVKLRGVKSQGMVLAAVGEDRVIVVSPSAPVPPGSQVR